MRTFVPNICCAHDWRPDGKEGRERCGTCGSTCRRDQTGQIVEYTRTGVHVSVHSFEERAAS